jgi:uncharacterized protein DUF4034
MTPRCYSRIPGLFILRYSSIELLRTLSGFVVIMVFAVGSAYASGTPGTRNPASVDCHVAEPDADSSIDVHALNTYGTFIRGLLIQGRYDALDCIADAARANKTKFSGGFWKIHTIYAGLERPVDAGAHATELDWNDHIDQLQRWISAKPNSVTARVALAQAYVDLAWEARGTGFANTVTDNGWKLVGERTHKAEEILKEANKLPTKCPEWYVTAQRLLQLQGTNKEELSALLGEAIACEPTYQYFYRLQAKSLAAKWYGDDGDEEAFVQQAADRLGGTDGDILYFQIASNIICPCNDGLNLKLLSWPRMQKGFKALTDKSGPSLVNMNLFAYMATREIDPTLAKQTFDGIGDNWDPDLWTTKSFFDQNKQWAIDGASEAVWEKSLRDKADADMRTPEGIDLKKKFDETFAARIQSCARSYSGADLAPFTFFLTLGEKGQVLGVTTIPYTKVSDCVVKQGPFGTLQPPPHAPFSLKIEVDPSKLITASLR